MKKILVLDDSKERLKYFQRELIGIDVTLVETAEECIKMLQEKAFNVAFLDHDLGGEIFVSTGHANSGSGVARWLFENPRKHTHFIVHSQNPNGAENMISLLRASGHRATYAPFRTSVYFNEIMERIHKVPMEEL